jgi:hypothetical protein
MCTSFAPVQREKESAKTKHGSRTCSERILCVYCFIIPLFSSFKLTVLYFNPPIAIRETIFSGLVDPERARAFYQRLHSLMPRHHELFVQLKSREFHFSKATIGKYETRADLQMSLLQEAGDVVGRLVQSVQEALPHHTVIDISVRMSHKNAKRQEPHQAFLSSAEDSLSDAKMPCSMLIPLHDFCVLDIFKDDALVGSHHIPVGYYAQFRGDTVHAGGINPLKPNQYMINVYLTTVNTPVPDDD